MSSVFAAFNAANASNANAAAANAAAANAAAANAAAAANNAAELEGAYARLRVANDHLRVALEDVAQAHEGRSKRKTAPPSRLTYDELSMPGFNSGFMREHYVSREDSSRRFSLGKRKVQRARGGAAAEMEEQEGAAGSVLKPVEPAPVFACIVCHEEMKKDDHSSLGCVGCTCTIHHKCWEELKAINLQNGKDEKTCPICNRKGGMTRLTTSFNSPTADIDVLWMF